MKNRIGFDIKQPHKDELLFEVKARLTAEQILIIKHALDLYSKIDADAYYETIDTDIVNIPASEVYDMLTKAIYLLGSSDLSS